MSRGEIAKQYFCNGYNCAQSVALAYKDKIGLDDNTIAMLSSGFGGGMGRMREVCGAMSGCVFVLSAIDGYDQPKNFDGKKELYAHIQSIGAKFKEENGSIICRELLALGTNGFDTPTPSKRNEQYYQKRPCGDIVKSAADILEEYINSNDIKNNK